MIGVVQRPGVDVESRGALRDSVPTFSIVSTVFDAFASVGLDPSDGRYRDYSDPSRL